MSAPKTLGGWRHLRKGAVDLGALSKAGVPVPPAALIGVPLTVGLIAGMLQRGRRRRVTPNSEVGVVPA